MTNARFNIKWFIVGVALTATVLFLSHLPPELIPYQLHTGGLDKLAHISGYGVIALLFVLSFRNPASLFSASLLFVAILTLGAIDEPTQPFVNRTASLADWLADLVGVTSVLLLFHVKRAKAKPLDLKKSLCEEA